MDISLIKNFNGQILHDEYMAEHTSYKIGGPAKYFALVNDKQSLSALIKAAQDNNLEWFIIGGGSNLLVSDDGFSGVVIKLAGDFCNIEFKDNKCYCGGAVSSAKFVKEMTKNNVVGHEFLCGIPGSIGGATKMNAGRKTEFISSLIDRVEVLDTDFNTKNIDKNDIDWGYRYSSFNNNQVILNVVFNCAFAKSNEEALQSSEKIASYQDLRKQNQPLSKPSCGSVFKNPENNSAGKLIEECGLKGHRLGGAQISDVHANFIVNENCARAADVVGLIKLAQQKVYDKFKIKLIPEVKFLGFNSDCTLF